MKWLKQLLCGLIDGHEFILRWQHYGPEVVRTTYWCPKCGAHKITERPRKKTL